MDCFSNEKIVVYSLCEDLGKVLREDINQNDKEFIHKLLKEHLNNEDHTLHALLTSSNEEHINFLKKLLNYSCEFAFDIANINVKDNTVLSKAKPLASIFNLLNNNSSKKYYSFSNLLDGKINFPIDTPLHADINFCSQLKTAIYNALKYTDTPTFNTNSLLTELENCLSFVPCVLTTDTDCYISLYEYLKIKSAIACCLYAYINENNLNKQSLTKIQSAQENAFLLCSMDFSGIQSFIYTISSKGAMKTLRARSFYLEILMEHVVDTLLNRLKLTRANLIYSGGGHCYFLLANTNTTKEILNKFVNELNDWFIDNFNIGLYMALAYNETNINSLKNTDKHTYSNLFIGLSRSLSKKKANRYNVQQILKLNNDYPDNVRECRICHKLDKLNSNNECDICESLLKLSNSIINDDFFAVLPKNSTIKNTLPLPFDNCLLGVNDYEAFDLLTKINVIRFYCKNRHYNKKFSAYTIYVGDFKAGQLDDFANEATGIDRFAVVRADIDNLGATFALGFKNKKEDKSNLLYTSILSKQLSIFFKLHINHILSNPLFTDISSISKAYRNVSIVYSGGDDLFIVGAWDDIVESICDIRNIFSKYCDNTLSISSGIRLAKTGYPIHTIAYETEELVEISKNNPNKNSITLFEEFGSFSWNEFLNNVIEQKYKLLSEYLNLKFFLNEQDSNSFKGKAFLYKLLNLFINSKDSINRARLVYLLARLEDSAKDDLERNNYKLFANNIYQWYLDKNHRKELITAIYLYLYKERNHENNLNGANNE